MRALLLNCGRERREIYIEDGVIVKDRKKDDYLFDCKGLPIRPLTCSLVSLKPHEGELEESWKKIMSDPMPPKSYFDFLILGGVGATGAVESLSHPVEVVKLKMLLDPMADRDTVEKYKGGVVARSITPTSSYGYKKERGKWPIEDIADLLDQVVLLNPLWVTTWEVKEIRKSTFTPTYVYTSGATSPIPLEMKKTMFSVGPSLYVGMSPIKEKKVAEIVASSHYWRRVKYIHEDETCWKTLSLEPPCLSEGCIARMWVGVDIPLFYINHVYVLSSDEILKIFYSMREVVEGESI